MTALAGDRATRARPPALPAGLPPLPPIRRRPRRRPPVAAAVVAAAVAPLVLLLAGVVSGGGPRTESADDALLTMAMRDASRGAVLVGPYSRFGWHHPGPIYLYLLSVPTRLWGGGPTGSWIGATALAAACVAGIVACAAWWGGTRAAAWTAAGCLFAMSGIGAGLFRDPWNPFAVTLPILFVAVACAFAATGRRGALPWAAVVGSLAIQTHVSTAPVVVAMIAVAGAAQAGRALRRPRARARVGDDDAPNIAHIPAALPALDLPVADDRWWQYRPDTAVALGILLLEWLPPLWDEAFGSHNLTALWNFFTSPHPTHSWYAAWREVVDMVGLAVTQHHAVLRDGIDDHHPVITTVVFVGAAVLAVALGARRSRPAAVWLGAIALIGAVTGAYSVTRIVGEPYRYLVLWLTVLPVLPLVGLAIALEGALEGVRLRRGGEAAGLGGLAATLVLAAGLGVAIHSALDAKPASALTDPAIETAYSALRPYLAAAPGPVHVVINDGERWPTASGLGLELERHGHPAHVDPPWTLLFGSGRRTDGREGLEVIIAGEDPTAWPLPTAATYVVAAGRAHLFVARRGPACWWGWLPFGGPACPIPAPAPPTAPASSPPAPPPPTVG